MSTLIVEKPASTEYAAPFEKYVSRVTETDVLGAMARQKDELPAALGRVRGEAERFRYAEGKWSIREVVGHIVDCERIFGYRALCIARGETGPLPGFEENDYAANSSAHDCPLSELLEEFGHVRQGHLALFKHLGDAAWRRVGTSNSNAMSVRALAYIVVGHPRHHLAVLQERYLPRLG
jgi:DinB superfamily